MFYLTLCGHTFVEEHDFEDLRSLANQCTVQELENVIKVCEKQEAYELCAVLLEVLQSKVLK